MGERLQTVTAEHFISELLALDIRLSVEGDRLRCSAPPGRLTAELEERIATAKPELIRALVDSMSQFQSIPRRSNPSEPLPLSSAQERFWFLQNFYPESSAFNITALRRFSTPIKTDALNWALNEVCRRHEVLRTGFPEIDGAPVQVVREQAPPKIPEYDLGELREPQRTPAIEACFRELAGHNFNLATGPMYRVAAVRVSDSEHCIVLTIHHIICDASSIGIFLAELVNFYEARISGSHFSPQPLPLQYGDFVLWEKKRLSSGALAPQMEYWKNKLKDAPKYLDFPLDRPRTPAVEYEARRHYFELDAAQSALLKGLLKRSGVTLNMLFLSVFEAVLFRYSRQSSIMIGTPVSMRTRLELENLIGCLINTQALRSDFPPGITTTQLLAQTRSTVLECLRNGDVPFENVVSEIVKERDLTRPPLFQVAFILQNAPLSADYEAISGGTTFDLTLYMWERNGSFGGSVEYNAKLFDAQTIAGLAGCFQTLAESMATDPDAPIDRLSLMTTVQESEFLEKHDGPLLDLPEGCVHEWIERKSSETPAAIAVICGGEELTYREISDRSNRLANWLRALGVGPGSLVAICLHRSADLVIAPLAVWKAGGAYVPLDPEFPIDRLAFMLEDSRAKALITEEALLGRLPTKVANTICVDRDLHTLKLASAEMPPSSAVADDLAYVIYTSGSTGKPKGVEVTHRSLVNFLASMQNEPGMRNTDRLLAVTTFSFDIAGLELYLPLVSGAQVVIAQDDATYDGAALAKLIAAANITVMQATPVTWLLLLQSGWNGTPALKVLCGGEALPRELAKRLTATECEVWNLYGPTETTIWSTLDRVNLDGRVLIGRPIANTQVHVLDDFGEPVPPGVPGELYIGGRGVARAYLHREDLTAERFIRSPRHQGARLYRTGDLVRRLSDGRLEWLQRIDNQIKLRGFRIELGEIESALEQQSEIEKAVLVVRQDAPADDRLVAYVTTKDHIELHPPALRHALQRSLPDYMVPAAFVKVKEFPLTANRKIDRKALLGPEYAPENREPGPQNAKESSQAIEGTADNSAGPGNHVESVMIEAWREVLAVEQVGIHDNFFELGGHSLSAVRLIAKLRSELGMELPLRCIFISPTIASLASHISYVPSESGYRYNSDVPEWTCLVPVQPRGTRTPLFCVAGFLTKDDTMFVLSRLIPHLGMDQPVFGLRPRWTQGGADYDSVDEMVHEFLTEMRAVQPHGPYLLGGWCVGGIAALELANSLIAQGEEVKLLLLIDTERPTKKSTLAKDFFFLRQRAGHIADVVTQVMHAAGTVKIQMIRELIRRKLGIAQSAESRERLQYYDSLVRYRRQLYAHSPAKYSGHITLITTRSEQQSRKGLGWTGFADGGLEVFTCPGDHNNIFIDHGKEVSAVILSEIPGESEKRQCIAHRTEAEPA